MPQKITVTKVEDHHEMQFDGGDFYPVPTNAIDKLDDDLTPEEIGESATFRGDYGGHKHAKAFDVEEVIETPGDDDAEEKESAENESEVASDVQDEGCVDEPAEVPDAVPYNSQTAGMAQQINAQRLFGVGDRDVDYEEDEQATDDAEESESGQDDDSEHIFASDDSECRQVDCDETPEMAAECDTGQTKYYCGDHAGGRRAGHARVENWRAV